LILWINESRRWFLFIVYTVREITYVRPILLKIFSRAFTYRIPLACKVDWTCPDYHNRMKLCAKHTLGEFPNDSLLISIG
jgi:hypothetical protein